MDDKTELAEQIPQTIGRYQIQDSIGYGAMGAVYRAFDPLIKRTLAIKTIRLDIQRSSPQYKSFIDRFYHEARISGTLNHPNIVTLFDIGEEGGLPFLAMEYVPGETIASIIDRGVRFNPERVVGLVSQVASAVDYAHSKTVIHRDIKPSNLILAEGDRVKVTDFGIAKIADTEMTQSGMLLGTPSYMSPEQAMGEKLDGRSDLFSLGVCAFEMLSGEQPFPGANVTSILYKLVHVDPIEPANLEMNGLVPQKWREVFGRVLAKRPDDRYQNAAAFVQDLELCLGSWFGAAMGDETTAMPAVGETALMTALPAAEAAALDGAEQVVEEEVPRTVLMSAASLPEEPATTILPPQAVTAIDSPEPDEGSAATVLIHSVTEEELEEPSTVILGAGEGEGATVALAAADVSAAAAFSATAQPGRPGSDTLPPTPLAAPEEGATVVMSSVETALHVASPTPVPATPRKTGPRRGGETLPPVPAGTAAAEPGARTASRGAPPPLPTVATRAGTPSPTPVPKSGQKPGPATGPKTAPPVKAAKGEAQTGLPLALLGGVGLLFVLAVVVGLLAVYQLRKGQVTSTTEPSTEATPTAAAAEASSPPAVVASEGLVRVSTQPPGATVTINGEPRGASPLELRLPLGLYEVQLALSGYERHVRSIEISAAKPQADVEITLTRPTAAQKGTADILSNPAGASVLVDGRNVGQTPLRAIELTPGQRKIEVQKPGYVAALRTLNVRVGKKVTVEIALAETATATPRPTPSPEVERVDTARVYLPRDVDSPARKTSGASPDAPPKPSKFKGGDKLSITVTFVVTESGEVDEVEITDVGDAAIDEKYREGVLRALRKWRFEPASKSGVKVKVREVRKFTYQFS